MDFKLFTINGKNINSEHTFFDEIAKALNFPSYFGKNWAAFNDSLHDFEELQEGRVGIIWENSEYTFHSDAQTFLQAICYLYNSAFSANLESTRANRRHKKQFEVFVFVSDNPLIETKEIQG